MFWHGKTKFSVACEKCIFKQRKRDFYPRLYLCEDVLREKPFSAKMSFKKSLMVSKGGVKTR